ncbi:zinc-binding dehydrogenase [Nocardioides sp. YIM 152588]|uniref:zinc-dependent alcohol dehydrogenase n=1 Tax=Nocardioides sp. YIM 152588 TaxID=3158259 RepID=UPI0032E38589
MAVTENRRRTTNVGLSSSPNKRGHMKALLADIAIQRYLFTAAAQKLPRGLGKNAGWGPGGILRLIEDDPAPQLPKAPGWVRLRPELSLICGSDVGLAHAKVSLELAAYYQETQQIPGHEFVAVVDEVGPGVTTVKPGDRVAVDAVISCAQRGFDDLCRSCEAGMPNVCERFEMPGVSGCCSPTLGFARTLGGGMAEQAIAHESQLFPIGDLPSRFAALTEPASIGLHAALRWQKPAKGARAVVIGPGAIGLLTVAALRRLHPDLHISVVSPGQFGSDWASRVGADRILPAGPAAITTVAEQDGGRLLNPTATPGNPAVPILEQGVDLVVDCVGSSDTIHLGLHLLRAKGTFVLAGAAGQQQMNWSLVWKRELDVLGTTDPGPEPALGGRRTQEQVLEWMNDGYPVDGMVTHTFELDEWQKAFETASAGPAARAIRVGIRTNPDLPLVTG